MTNHLEIYRNMGWLTNPETMRREWQPPVTPKRIDWDHLTLPNGEWVPTDPAGRW